MSSTTVSLTSQDLLSAWRLQRRNNFAVQFALWFPLLLAAFYLLSSWRDLANYGWQAVVEDPFYPLIIVLVATLNIVVDKVSLPRRARRTLEQQKGIGGEIAFAWDSAGLQVTGPTGHNRLAWGDYIKWLEDDASLILFQGDNLFNPFPKRCLTDDQIAEIRGYLTAALGKPGKKRKTRSQAF